MEESEVDIGFSLEHVCWRRFAMENIEWEAHYDGSGIGTLE